MNTKTPYYSFEILKSMGSLIFIICEQFSVNSHDIVISLNSAKNVFFLMKFNSSRRKPGESKLDLRKVEPQLNRLKNKHYPIKPKTSKGMAAELKKSDAREKFGQTLDKQRQFYIDSVVRSTFSFHLFASLAVISFIKDHIKIGERFYSMDGTFQVVPKGLSQLLIISIQFKSKVGKI